MDFFFICHKCPLWYVQSINNKPQHSNIGSSLIISNHFLYIRLIYFDTIFSQPKSLKAQLRLFLHSIFAEATWKASWQPSPACRVHTAPNQFELGTHNLPQKNGGWSLFRPVRAGKSEQTELSRRRALKGRAMKLSLQAEGEMWCCIKKQ